MIIEDALKNSFCVYGHFSNGRLFHVEAATLRRAFSFTGGDRTLEWRQALGRDGVLSIRIFKQFATLAEARAFATRMRPPVVQHKKGVVAVHLATGRRMSFPTIHAARKALDISQGAISNSLAGRYPTVGGYQFERPT